MELAHAYKWLFLFFNGFPSHPFWKEIFIFFLFWMRTQGIPALNRGIFFYLDQVGGIQLSFWTRRARNVFVIYNFFISFCFYFPILRCIDNFVLPFVKAPPYLRLKEKFWLKLYEGKVVNILYSADEPQTWLLHKAGVEVCAPPRDVAEECRFRVR